MFRIRIRIRHELQHTCNTHTAYWYCGALQRGSLTFVSQAGMDGGIQTRFGLGKTLAVAKNMRGVRKQHMVHNHYLPTMEIDAQTYSVRADGQLLTCEPATSLPMAQRYFLF